MYFLADSVHTTHNHCAYNGLGLSPFLMMMPANIESYHKSTNRKH